MEKRNKGIQDRIDRLSDLPDGILHHILSFLDTEFSVQTCILSRRWRCLWKYVPVLTFTERSLWSEQRLERFVDNVLSLRSDSSSISKVTIDFGEEDNKHLFERVMKYAASHGVQDLFVLMALEVVTSVCSCYRSLKVLELKQTNIGKEAVELWSCLQLLESLTLTACRYIYHGAAHDAFANFPRLETLKLHRCYHYGDFSSVLKVTAPRLLNLEITVPGFYNLEIVTPKLQSFTLELDSFSDTVIPDVSSKSNLPSLNRANIRLLNWHEFLEICSSSDYDYPRQKHMMFDWCASLFKILHNVQALDLQVGTFELIVEICNWVNRQASPFGRMKSLSLKHSGESVGVVPSQVISYFLGESPNEEGKHFTVEHVPSLSFVEGV
ncbi:Putative F-box/LRR-repeat protein At5g02930 [Linum perenne]